MCGRYTLRAEPEAVQQAFDLERLPDDWSARYNMAPTQQLPAITNTAPRQLTMLQWGLIPSWSRDPAVGSKLINARAETIDEKLSFRESFQRRRCLIPADGFFEWQQQGASKRPMFVHLQDHALFAFAGLWDTWRGPSGQPLTTFTIITTEPNALLRTLHHRMAVILDRGHYRAWLADATEPDQLRAMLKPCPDEQMRVYPVSSLVNSPSNDSPAVVQRYEAPRQQSLF